MALIDSLEKSGTLLFKYRGQLPVVLFILAIPVVYFTDLTHVDENVRGFLLLLAILVSFLGFLIRIIAIGTTPKGTSGRNTREQVAEVLNQTGIYSLVRHPLYFGNYLMWIGIVIFTYNFYFIIIVSLAFWLYYERIMIAEEMFLERKFGQSYRDWSFKVPAFIPSWRHYIPGKIPFSWKTILRREYSGLLATVFSFAFVDHLRYFANNSHFEFNRVSTFCFIAAFFVALILRTLKHQTRLLLEENRS